MTQRIYRNKKYVRHRIDKTRYADREEIKITTETPTHRIVETRTAEYKTEKHQIPKEENGSWDTPFKYHGFTVRHSKTSDRYWLFYRDQFLTELSKIEQYEFFKRGLQSVGGFREKIDSVKNGKRYTVFVLKAESRWKAENS